MECLIINFETILVTFSIKFTTIFGKIAIKFWKSVTENENSRLNVIKILKKFSKKFEKIGNYWRN